MPPKKRSRSITPNYTVVDYGHGDLLYLGRNKGQDGKSMGNLTFFSEDHSKARLKRGQGVPVNQSHIMDENLFNRFGPKDQGDLMGADGIDTLNSAALVVNTGTTARNVDRQNMDYAAKSLVNMKHSDGTKRKKRRKKRTNGKKKKKTKGGRKSHNRRRKTRR